MGRHTARREQVVNQFAMLPSASIPRSAFNRPHGYKCTLDAGYLVPFYCQEVLPGDTFNVKANILARLATPITPFMDNVYIETQFFFVPNRLCWTHWVNMMGEKQNPDDSVDFICPEDTAPAETGWTVGSLYDYFGLPTGVPGIKANALYRRAYYRIFNEWYRSEQLQDSEDDGLEVSDNGQTKDFPLVRRNKFHDYFTAALPYPQAGPASSIGLAGDIPITAPDTGATIKPLQTISPVIFNYNHFGYTGGSPDPAAPSDWGDDLKVFWSGSGADGPGYIGPAQGSDDSQVDNKNVAMLSGKLVTGMDWKIAMGQLGPNNSNPNNPPHFSNLGADAESIYNRSVEVAGFKASIAGLTAQMSQVGLLSINDIRQAFQIQKLLEKDARGGTRYVEHNLIHFGVRSPDARLQRPEYLGGSRTPLYVNAVAQTSSTNSTTPQGNLSAYGFAADSFHGFTKSFVEHGVVIGLVSIRADLSYQQGIHRMWSRSSRFDFYYPVFAHLGEQAVLNKEIYAQGPTVLNDDNKPVDDDAFGYQERYAEYRYAQSIIAGKMRSTYAQSLDIWHLAQQFSELPKLNSEFIEENPPIDRVIAVQDEPQFILDAYFDEKTVRPMPVYSVPGLVDHF